MECCWQPTAGEMEAVLEGVGRAIVEALHVPEGDPTVIGTVRPPDSVVLPSKGNGRYTIVTVTMFAGRTLDTKRRLYDAVVERLHSTGVPPSDTVIVLDEIPMENWGVNGGIPASEVDAGFRVDI